MARCLRCTLRCFPGKPSAESIATRRRHMRMKIALLAGAFALLALPALPQTNPTGTISGKVSDQQGLALPGVAVTAQSPNLQGSRSVTTSTNGDYIIPFLHTGDYSVTFELPAF